MKWLVLISTAFLIACSQPATQNQEQVNTEEESQSKTHLASWNDGPTKDAIIAFVEAACDTTGENFIPVEDRIAVFDNDGTLWSEKPLYFQLYYAMDEVKRLASEHPEWNNQQPFQAVIEDDMEAMSKFTEKDILALVIATHSGITTDEFAARVTNWISTATHPTTGMKYNEMVYQPMLELLDYLRANEFKTFIVSGGGVEFMRVWASEVYDIPSHQIIGSTVKTEFVLVDGKPQINRLPEIGVIDDKAGKPVMINQIIGKKPVFCGGNSDGDLQMMQWTASNDLGSFMLYIHHTDAEREWAYDRDSHVGRFDAALDEAMEKGWTLVDMTADWKVVY